jgi:hypothetical protein
MLRRPQLPPVDHVIALEIYTGQTVITDARSKAVKYMYNHKEFLTWFLIAMIRSAYGCQSSIKC